jgi:putative NIF3 family GTP cyclohydrolase 1 type 2
VTGNPWEYLRRVMCNELDQQVHPAAPQRGLKGLLAHHPLVVFLHAYLNAFFENGYRNSIDEAIRSYRKVDVSNYEEDRELSRLNCCYSPLT